MLPTSTINTIVHAYHRTEGERVRIRPPSVQYDGFTIEDAYQHSH